MLLPALFSESTDCAGISACDVCASGDGAEFEDAAVCTVAVRVFGSCSVGRGCCLSVDCIDDGSEDVVEFDELENINKSGLKSSSLLKKD